MRDATVKLARLREILSDMETVAVTFSGGVDSTFLAAVAHAELGDRAVAFTGVSESLDPAEREAAIELAARIGIRHELIDTREMEVEGYVRNSAGRCYFCKSELFDRVLDECRERGLVNVVDGTNANDATDHRPGARAAEERGVRSPLREAGLTKAEIRTLSRDVFDLPTWDKPELACLASRIPYGTEVTPERLARVARAEAALRALGFRELRVRHHGDVARIELAPAEMGRAMEEPLRGEIARRVTEAGFRYAALDLEGYRRGSLNEGLSRRERPGGNEQRGVGE